MPGPIWDIGELVSEEDIPYEQEVAKNPFDLSNWLRYYRFKSSASSCTFRNRIFILERAVKQLPRSYKLWMIYIDLSLQEMQNSNSYKSKSELLQVNVIFERSLQLLNRSPILWLKYLEFLFENEPYEITLLRRKFNECLYNLPISQHHIIWPLYIRFADKVGGMTGVKVYLKYLQYATPESLQGLNNEQEGELGITIDDVISKLIEFGDVKEASKLFQHILQHTDKFIGLAKSPLQLWIEYIDLLVNSVSKNKRGTVNYNELDYFFENLIKDGLQKFPDQIGKFYLKLTFYFIKRKNLFKARYYFDEGLQTCVSVKDFTMIFDSYTEFEENILTNMSEKLERLGEDNDLNNELDMRMIAFEKLINDRPHLLNDMMLRQDVNNLDEWFKKIELFKEENNMNKMLDTYAAALRTINPLKAHSFSNNKENTLPSLWINYANVYALLNDVKTANLIFSKSVKSQFQSPDDLATLYIEWSELFVRNKDDKKAIEIIESICTSELMKFDYNDSSIDIHIRVRKSIKLWSFYLDLLESMIENSNQSDEIEKVINAYNRTIDLKIATPLTIINFANFLEDWNFYERSFSVYEIGLKIFKDSKIKFEIWNIYLSKIIKHDVNIERIRDLFEQCLNETSIEGYTGCPANLSKPVYLLYSQYEQSKGWITKSIKVLKQGLSKLEDGYKQDSYTKAEKDTMLQDKFDIYQILITKVFRLNDSNETRKVYEQSLKDKQLPLRSLIQLAREFINFETELMEFNRVRSLFKFVCQLSNPQSPLLEPVWNCWETFELSHGTESTFKEMLRYKRKIIAEFENDIILKNSLNPMGFVKSSEGPKVSSINMSESKEEINPDSIELDMDM